MRNSTDNTLTIVLIIFLLIVLFGGFGMMGFGGMGGMMRGFGFNYGNYGIMPIFGPIIMLLITIAVVLFIVWAIKQISYEERRKNGKRK